MLSIIQQKLTARLRCRSPKGRVKFLRILNLLLNLKCILLIKWESTHSKTIILELYSSSTIKKDLLKYVS
jgi:hypothetical protein